MAVGVRLERGQERAARRQQGLQRPRVFAQRRAVHLHPGPGPTRVRALFVRAQAQEQEGQRAGQGERQRRHGQEVREVVLDEEVRRAQDLCRAAHPHDAERVQDVHKARERPQRWPLRARAGQQQAVEEQRRGDEEDRHAVVPGPGEGAQRQRLPRKEQERQRKARPRRAARDRQRPAPELRAQQQEQRGEKDAVARKGGEGEQRRIPGLERGQARGKAVVAVPEKARGVEQRRRGQRPGAPQRPPQQQRQAHAQQRGGEVPEVVVRSVEEEQAHGGQGRKARVLPAVDPQRQVEQDARAVEQPRLAQEAGQAARPARLQQGQQRKLPRRHQEEGHRQPRQNPRQQELRIGAHIRQGIGVQRHDQQRRQGPEAVKRPEARRAGHAPPPIPSG